MKYTEIPVSKAADVIDRIGREWMLIGAVDKNKGPGAANAMTASWGTIGVLWSRPVAICFIRPQRYTYGLAENEDKLSLSFFGPEKKAALAICGRESGRDGDKLERAGLSYEITDDVPVFDDAKMTLVCRKLYADDLREDKFVLPDIAVEHYPQKDYHRFYVLEIEKVLAKE